ncbi:GAF domain-containing protein [Thiovibrio frasassiensis]|uniref:GAF domain-containing protein n=1 Tax=Thiovibrio frasassiensis TaxID=2984131 RepID=A0A9X4MID6_9BACT|nr:GAF domain-containing protein [Thiovibrio frasassiensis]MDG4476098.1 GAF domain-containing protein [Thiovibrio frasassiensis]
MAFPLKKTIPATAVSVAVILVALLCLGIRQYQLYRNYAEVSRQTEKLVFQFAVIREHVTENLLEGQYGGLASVGAELEELNLNLATVIGNRFIDDHYKLTLANAIDLPGLVLLVRKISGGPAKPEYLRQLNTEIRTLGERLMLFDRVLVEHGKRELISFQNVVIGALAMVVSLIIVLLLFFQRRLIAPLLALVQQVKEVATGTRGGLAIGGRSGEISELAYSFHDLLTARDITAQGLAKFQRVASAVTGAQLAIARSKSRASLFREVCRALLANHEYCLVWIGQPDETGDIMPVTADGATSMSNKECETCMAVLLTEAEDKGGERNPAALALRSKAPVVRVDILAGIPKGLLKGTPLADGHAACAALPVIWQNTVYGVLSIYALSPSDFDTKEMELLEGLAGDLGLALHTIEGQQHLLSRENLHAQLFEALRVIQLSLSPAGAILGVNPVFAGMAGVGAEQIVGRDWRDFFSPVQAAPPGDTSDLLEKLRSDAGAELMVSRLTGSRRFLCRIVPEQEGSGEPERLILVGYPLVRVEGVGGCEANLGLEMIADLAGGVSHEVSDLSNGLINYAQVLADEEQLRRPGQPENEVLAKVIEAGERIAEIVRKFILYGQDEVTAAGEFLPVATVLEDALLLIGYHLKSEGIQLETDLEAVPPAFPVHAQHMQQVFLSILSTIRTGLVERFAARDPRKKLSITTHTRVENGQGRMFEISIMDHGAVIPLESGHNQEPRSGRWGRRLGVCRRIVEEHGGRLVIGGEEEEYVRIRFSFPLKGD